MVMIATVAAATSTIRVGSGGIMLPNHAPLAVAESFRVLEGLHPGRIDLGLGRAPGTDQLTAYALRRGRVEGDEFPQQLAELLAYVDGFPEDHPFAPLRAIPDDVPLPPLWILGSSLYGGQAAAAFGTGFAFAGHFGSADPAEAVAGYRDRFEPSDRLAEPRVALGVAAIVSESEERAEALARANDLSMVRLMQNRPGPVPTAEEAAAHAVDRAGAGAGGPATGVRVGRHPRPGPRRPRAATDLRRGRRAGRSPPRCTTSPSGCSPTSCSPRRTAPEAARYPTSASTRVKKPSPSVPGP